MKKRMVKVLSMCLTAGLILAQPMAVWGAEDENAAGAEESQQSVLMDVETDAEEETDDTSSKEETDAEESEAPVQAAAVETEEETDDVAEVEALVAAESADDTEVDGRENEDSEGTGDGEVSKPLQGQWRSNKNGKWFVQDQGSFLSNGIFEIAVDGGSALYAFDKEGYMVTGWYKTTADTGVIWYYFDKDGTMHTGWVKVGSIWYYLDPATGIMHADCQEVIKGKTYAFTSSGAMRTGWYKQGEGGALEAGWYYFDKTNGDMKTGWIKDGKIWYYLDPNTGLMWSDCQTKINGKVYAFESSGAMRTGWYKKVYEDSTAYEWYYFDKTNGDMKTGWVKDGKNWYYLDPDTGVMHSSCVEMIDDKCYAFKVSGAMITGWYSQKGDRGYDEWYYFDTSGARVSGWKLINKKWYYFAPDTGVMYSNCIADIKNVQYGFNAEGDMATGWYQQRGTDKDGNVGNYWYYFNTKSGAMCTGWVPDNNAWYYLDSDTGIMYANCTIEIGGRNSKFDANGKWLGYVKE